MGLKPFFCFTENDYIYESGYVYEPCIPVLIMEFIHKFQ